MARQITEWRDAPYIYEDGLYYDKRGGTPCRTIEEAYRERYKKEIKDGSMPKDPYCQGGYRYFVDAVVLMALVVIAYSLYIYLVK